MPCGRRTRHRFQASFRWMDHCIFWRLGFRQSSFHQYHAGLSVHRSIRLDTITDLLPGCCSLCLSTPGEASGPRIFLRILPGCAGDTSRRFVAHHAIFPSRFPVQVSQATQEPPSEFLPTASGIQRSASRRTQGVPLSCSFTAATATLTTLCSPGLDSDRLSRYPCCRARPDAPSRNSFPVSLPVRSGRVSLGPAGTYRSKPPDQGECGPLVVVAESGADSLDRPGQLVGELSEGETVLFRELERAAQQGGSFTGVCGDRLWA